MEEGIAGFVIQIERADYTKLIYIVEDLTPQGALTGLFEMWRKEGTVVDFRRISVARIVKSPKYMGIYFPQTSL